MRWQALTMLALTLAACPADPVDSDTDTGDADTVDPDTDTVDPDTDTADPDTDTADPDTDTDTAFQPADCHTLPADVTPFGGSITDASLMTTTEPTTDAGLAAVKAAAQATIGGDAATVNLAVTNAIVTSLGDTPSNSTSVSSLWLADSTAAMRVDTDADSGAPLAIEAGDAVSFTVTQVHNDGGDLTITALADFTINTSGNPVPVRESNGTTLSYGADGRYVHHLWGALGSSSECGAFTCFDFITKDESGTRVTHPFRLDPSLLGLPLATGDCIELVAPLSTVDGSAQFTLFNPSWQRWYGNYRR